MSNALYYGDNLTVLRESIKDESVDLIYLDPPFNSNASYNVLFKGKTGEQSAAQIEAFEDTWQWNQTAELAFDEVVTSAHSDAAIMLRAMRSALGENNMMAYLAMMAVRLIELHRVLKHTGSLYLHCDPTASHYLKILLDSIFGVEGFRNEIIWRRTRAHNDRKIRRYGSVHDTILFYSKSQSWLYNVQFLDREENAPKTHDLYTHTDGKIYRKDNCRAPGGRGPLYDWNGHIFNWRFSPEERDRLIAEGRIVYSKTGMPRVLRPIDPDRGSPLQDVWTDVNALNSGSAELLGYPTQKPISLLERIIACSSNEDQVILDPFCGCGTTVHAAQKLGRQWFGIDVTHLAIALVERRLKEAFPSIVFNVYGVPKDSGGARDLAERDKYEFQKWITATVGAQPYKSGKKGMDRGIDGYLHFRDGENKPQFAIVSVKGGGIKSGDVRDLKGTMEREKAAMGLFLTLNEPTREMVKEAASAGIYETAGQKMPRLQILTAADILEGKRPQAPFGHTEGFKKAPKEESAKQSRLL